MQLEVGKSFCAFLRRRKTEGLRLPEHACFLCVQTSSRKTVGEIYDNTENKKIISSENTSECAGSTQF